MARRTTQADWEVSPAELLEQAFALLRSLPPSALAWCVIGPLPFVLGLLFFWSEMTRSGEAALSAFGWSVVMALLFAWLKVTQGLFARSVWQCLLPEPGLPPLRAGGFFRRTAALLAISALSLPMQGLAALVVLPFAWVYGTFQNATVLAYTQEVERREFGSLLGASARQAHHEPLGHHLTLVLLFLFGCLVWGSLFATGLAVPMLLKILTGVESAFSSNLLAAAINSLYLAVTVSVAWIIVSPFFRVAYVLRAFHALSRSSGMDLLSRLAAIKRRAAVVAVAWGLGLALGGSPAVAQEAAPPADAPPPAAVAPATEKLAEAIRTTLSRRDYQWRLPRETTEPAVGSSLLAGIKRFIEAVRGVFRGVDTVMRDLIDGLRKLLGGRALPGSGPASAGASLDSSALRGLVYLLGVVALVAVMVLVARWIIDRRKSSPSGTASGPLAAPVDLASDETLASQLPEDQWVLLAREQMAAGDARLAVRALFLATLASLGDQRLIEIARSKSNRDYGDELRLRAIVRRDLPEVFGQSVGVFERVWYGLHDALPQWVQQLMDNYERIKRAPTP